MKSSFLILIFSTLALSQSAGLSMTGADDFKILARSGKIVDKTLLIRDLIEQNDLVTLITRPRRWGKSTSVSMLWRFFALENDPAEAQDNRRLFDSFKIKNVTQVFDKYQGKCPSIFISFKDVRGENLDQLVIKLKSAISLEFRRNDYLAKALERSSQSNNLSSYDQDKIKSDLNKFKRLALNDGKNASIEELEDSLKFLSDLLYDYHGKKHGVCVFFDEYDAPLHKAFIKGYLTDGTDVIRNIFGAVLKGNPILERAVLTGILRLAGANLFSGLNNLVEDNVLNSKYRSHYGFTEEDVDELFSLFNMELKNRHIFKKAYNGYKFYSLSDESSLVNIYNPWSVTRYLKNNATLDHYWIGTGGTELLDHLVVLPEVQDGLETLRNGRSITLTIPKDVTFSSIERKPETLWPLLVHSGYLTLDTPANSYMGSNEYVTNLIVPNTEVLSAHHEFHNKWLQKNDLPRKSSIAHFSSLIKAIAEKNQEDVLTWIRSEKASGNPIDFTASKWNINPLQLAALSGNLEILKAVHEQYPALASVNDSEGLSIGDYALLSSLDSQNIPEPSVLREGVPGVSEYLCRGDGAPLLIIDSLVFGGGSTILGKTAERLMGAKGSNLIMSAYFAIGTVVQSFKIFGNILLKGYFKPTCERYEKYNSVPSQNYSTLRQFGEYILRNPGSYISMTACKANDTLISQFNKSVTDVKYAEIEPLTFSLCKPKSNSEL